MKPGNDDMADHDLTESLNKLLLDTAEAFFRTAQAHHGRGAAGEYEIHLAVRRRALPVDSEDAA